MGLRHQGCPYGSDAEFLAMAAPLVRDGLARGEPVLVATTSANLELLHEAMGAEADGVDYAEAAYFGRRPPQWATAIYRFDGDLAAVRRYVLDRATPLLRSEDDVATFGIAVGESITYLLGHGITRVSVWVRSAAGRVVCTLHSDQPLAVQPFLGLRHGDALWLTNQICEWLDVSADAAGCTVELAVPGQRAAEAFGV